MSAAYTYTLQSNLDLFNTDHSKAQRVPKIPHSFSTSLRRHLYHADIKVCRFSVHMKELRMYINQVHKIIISICSLKIPGKKANA